MFENIFRNCRRYLARSDSSGVIAVSLPGNLLKDLVSCFLPLFPWERLVKENDLSRHVRSLLKVWNSVSKKTQWWWRNEDERGYMEVRLFVYFSSAVRLCRVFCCQCETRRQRESRGIYARISAYSFATFICCVSVFFSASSSRIGFLSQPYEGISDSMRYVAWTREIFKFHTVPMYNARMFLAFSRYSICVTHNAKSLPTSARDYYW